MKLAKEVNEFIIPRPLKTGKQSFQREEIREEYAEVEG
jgi:hypothetical protein